MANEQVLAGVKVLTLTRIIVGPHSARMLAEHGAEVIEVETAGHPDTVRVTFPYKDGKPGLNRSGYFSKYNLNKRSVAINLDKSQGRELFLRLVKWSDVVIESNAPAVMPKLGLTYDELKKVKPDIIMVSTNLMGQSGPWHLFKAYGAQAAAMAGFYHLTGYPDEDPPGVFGAYTDMVAPQWIVCAILAALIYRRTTGKGQYIEHSQLEAGIHWLSLAVLDYEVNGRIAKRVGNRYPQAAPHGVYRCRGDDRWCAICVSTDEEWRSFCQVIGAPEWTVNVKFVTLLNRKANEDEIDHLVEKWTVNLTAEQVMNLLQTSGVPAGIVATSQDLHYNPQLKHRQHFSVLDHKEMGPTIYDAPPYRLSKTPWRPTRAAPLLGEDNDYVCRQILGMSDDEIAQLIIEGAFE